MPGIDATQILNTDQKNKIIEARNLLRSADQHCALCEKAGLDMTTQRQQIESLTKLAEGLITTFVSPRRRPG